MTEAQTRITRQLAVELGAAQEQVRTATALLDEGSTVPFIARYRKEATGGLDDGQLRLLEERLSYLRELEDRRATILGSIEEQGKLDDPLREAIEAAETKARLEDLYLPYKPKRRTRAQIAREAGLAPLAELLTDNPASSPESHAEAFVDPENGVADIKAALDGARAILTEQLAEDAALIGDLREWLWGCGQLHASVFPGKEQEGAKYRDYFDHAEAVARIPSHRLLALMRARNEGVLAVDLVPIVANSAAARDEDRKAAVDAGHEAAVARVVGHSGWQDQGRPGDAWLQTTARHAWLYKLHVSLGVDLMVRAREQAEAEAIRIFGDNLQDLLMAAPAGQKGVIGLDPALRTGVKVAVVDATGKLVATDTLYPHAPRNQWDQALTRLAQLADQHEVELIAIGNGTASRETDRLAAELIRKHPEFKLQKLVISEAGASVYSASALAAHEFPELDVSLRGAVSIARRLQDPLAELVKIDPKAIGVGQYQHDVNQGQLARALDARVEDCVNAVGVELNTASAPLLARVAGLSSSVAENVVQFREAEGAFANRRDLLKVPRLGEKTFEQCAGFLRIARGQNPLDRSAVHPEAYPVVERILAKTGRSLADLLGDSELLKSLRPTDFTDDRFGEPTVRDIIAELEKPGRDPRPEFRTAAFAEGVEDIKDLQPGMILEGVVSNVAAFGAFIDLGVHQDGLVHVSALSDKFVKDPREVVKAGDIVSVKVMAVDLERKRISLSMRLDDALEDAASPAGKPAQAGANRSNAGRRQSKGKQKAGRPGTSGNAQPPGNNALADAFARAKRK